MTIDSWLLATTRVLLKRVAVLEQELLVFRTCAALAPTRQHVPDPPKPPGIHHVNLLKLTAPEVEKIENLEDLVKGLADAVGITTGMIGKIAGNVVEHHNILTSSSFLRLTSSSTATPSPTPIDNMRTIIEEDDIIEEDEASEASCDSCDSLDYWLARDILDERGYDLNDEELYDQILLDPEFLSRKETRKEEMAKLEEEEDQAFHQGS